MGILGRVNPVANPLLYTARPRAGDAAPEDIAYAKDGHLALKDEPRPMKPGRSGD